MSQSRAFGKGYQPFLYQINDTVRHDAVTVRAGIVAGLDGSAVFPDRDTARPEFRHPKPNNELPLSNIFHELLEADTENDDTLVAPRLFLSSVIGYDVEPDASQAIQSVLVEPRIAHTLRAMKAQPQGGWEDSLWMLTFATKLLSILREGKQVGATHLLIEPHNIIA
jgi:hypothetical protein